MGRGKRRLLARQGSPVVLIPLSTHIGAKRVPEVLKNALKAAAKVNRDPFPAGGDVLVYRQGEKRYSGRAFVLADGTVETRDRGRVSYGRAYLGITEPGEQRVAVITDHKDDHIATVRYGRTEFMVEALDTAGTVVLELFMRNAKNEAGVFDLQGDPIGEVKAKRGQRLDLLLAGVGAWCFLAQ
jgi:hypothetical protein